MMSWSRQKVLLPQNHSVLFRVHSSERGKCGTVKVFSMENAPARNDKLNIYFCASCWEGDRFCQGTVWLRLSGVHDRTANNDVGSFAKTARLSTFIWKQLGQPNQEKLSRKNIVIVLLGCEFSGRPPLSLLFSYSLTLFHQ